MAASKAATTSAWVRNLSSFQSITGRTVCHSSALLASSTGSPSSRPARMMAPSAQKRRAYRDPTGTGISSQVKAKDRLHQRRSSEIRSRPRESTATAASTLSACLFTYQGGIGLGLTGPLDRAMTLIPRTSPAVLGICFVRSLTGVQSKGMHSSLRYAGYSIARGSRWPARSLSRSLTVTHGLHDRHQSDISPGMPDFSRGREPLDRGGDQWNAMKNAAWRSRGMICVETGSGARRAYSRHCCEPNANLDRTGRPPIRGALSIRVALRTTQERAMGRI
jgi:hypothetical protein